MSRHIRCHPDKPDYVNTARPILSAMYPDCLRQSRRFSATETAVAASAELWPSRPPSSISFQGGRDWWYLQLRRALHRGLVIYSAVMLSQSSEFPQALHSGVLAAAYEEWRVVSSWLGELWELIDGKGIQQWGHRPHERVNILILAFTFVLGDHMSVVYDHPKPSP